MRENKKIKMRYWAEGWGKDGNIGRGVKGLGGICGGGGGTVGVMDCGYEGG